MWIFAKFSQFATCTCTGSISFLWIMAQGPVVHLDIRHQERANRQRMVGSASRKHQDLVRRKLLTTVAASCKTNLHFRKSFTPTFDYFTRCKKFKLYPAANSCTVSATRTLTTHNWREKLTFLGEKWFFKVEVNREIFLVAFRQECQELE